MLPGAFRTKSLSDILASAEKPHTQLRRALGPVHVTMLGIGAVIGAGIFATVGEAAAGVGGVPGAGPSLVLSFVITAIACGFTALCYAEFASMVPISGSAYTYAYSTLGEWIAWIIGWDLIIEYAIGNVAVAISWGNYFREFLGAFGIHVPQWLCIDYRTAARIDGFLADQAPHILGIPIVCNLFAFLVVMAITIVLVLGIRESATVNAGMVLVKIIVLVFFVGAALYFVSPAQMVENWKPFQPNGWVGTLTGASIVFFAFIGFDAVSTVAEETRKPSRDIPIGILASLAICTVLYCVVSAAFTGMLPYESLVQKLSVEKAEPLTMAIEHVAPDARWVRGFVAFGSVVAHSAVLLVFQLGQPRIFFAMARDGLLPPTFTRVHARFRTPYMTTIVTGLCVALLASFASIDEMVALTNIGTLFAFTLVCIGIPILRIRDPQRTRAFKVPFGPFVFPLLGAASCLGLTYFLPTSSWFRFAAWLLIGMAVYCAYGYSHSAIGQKMGRASITSISLLVAAVGFLVLAVGTFLIPHNQTPMELWRSAADAAAEFHRQARNGLLTIGTGLLLAIVGLFAQNLKRPN